MANQQIIDYIKKTEESGYSDDQIKDALKKQGWQDKDIDEAIAEAHGAKKIENPVEEKKPEPAPSPENNQPSGFKKRNAVLQAILPIFTFGISYFIWFISTTNELRKKTKTAPNPWLLLTIIIPVVGFIVMIMYYWKYCSAVSEMTKNNKIVYLLLLLFVAPVGIYIVQTDLNKLS
jgi:uncharacterized membrane protein YidH (DUF202 family)